MPAVLLSGLLVLGALATAGFWFVRARTSAAVAPLAAADQVSTTTTSTTPPATDPAGLAAFAPELTQDAAAQLIAASSPSSSQDLLARRGLLLATSGFASMPGGDVRALGALFSKAYARLAPADRDVVSSYVQRLRSGTLTAAESARGRRLMTTAVNGLSASDRSRLQALFERAVAAGLASEELATARTEAAQAAFVAPPMATSTFPVEAAPEPGPGAEVATASEPSGPKPAGPTGNGEAYWRSRMRTARARVAELEARVADLDRRANASAVGSGLVETCRVADDRIRTRDDERALEECMKRAQNQPQREQAERQGILEQLAQTRRDLETARAALAALEEEARRAGALPGWLRE